MHKLALVTLLLFAALPARAESVAILSINGGLLASASGDQLYGWFFTANHEINVTQLGLFDSDSDGLDIAHQVGIFRVSDQALLGSAVVPSGTAGTLLSGFRYTGITSLSLLAGQYAIVMTMPDNILDGQYIAANGVTTSSAISWTGSAFIGSSTLVYPSWDASVFNAGMMGPNFQYTDVSTLAETPEPGPAFLVVGGGIALSLLRRRMVRL